MIPMTFLPKLGCFTVQIQGVTIHVRLVDRAAMVGTGLSELKPLIGKTTAVGLMVYRFGKPAILQLCVATRCLLVHLTHMDSIPDCLKCIECKSCIEVSELVARYFKKPNIYGRGLAAVAAEVGLSLEESPKKVDAD
ncbi:hypothetical protein RHGRI_014380 [Rhododendron griersonianum]|uniref:Uncharacterized protein n=1 Tax=Rhododendron griersonianum TaxID=479676 RepID=A0AAV6K928_9ERIC|nr:hypothetical protein RHGRI_014380 [Rhododendron griersonianum]